MGIIEIDNGAVEAAHSAMLGIRETIGARYTQHNHASNCIEGLLANAASDVLGMTSMTGLDPFSVWERWGFGGVAYSCSATSGVVDQTRGTARQIVEQISNAHHGSLAPVLHDRALSLQSSLGNAHESLGTILSLLNPGNILRLMGSPWVIMEHFSATQSALNLAYSLAQDYSDFLARLAAREQTLIEEIMGLGAPAAPSTLHVTPVSQGSSLQDSSSITIQGNSGYLQGSPNIIQGTQPSAQAPAAPSSVAQYAAEVTPWLVLGTDDAGIYGYNHIDWSKVPGGKGGDLAKSLQQFFQTDPSDWLFGNDPMTPNVQCVAFVHLVYQRASKNKIVMPAVGDANKFWAAYANNAYKDWTEVPNAEGSNGWPPRAGDVMVSTASDHVAIVTNVHTDSHGQVDWIKIAEANAPTPTETLYLKNGKIDPNMNIDGFVRYTGPELGG